MSEYNLTLGQAMQRAIDDGVTIIGEYGISVKVVGGNLVDTEDFGIVSGPLDWHGQKFKVVEKKKRLMTVVEIFEKYPDARFDRHGALDFDNDRHISPKELKDLGGEYSESWCRVLMVEED